MTLLPDGVSEATKGYAARVLPVGVELKASNRVLLLDDVRALLSHASRVALGPCECRQEAHRCGAPVDTCLAVDKVAEEMVLKRAFRYVTLQEALAVSTQSHGSGLVHLALQREGEAISYVCSCCKCCCWFLIALRPFGYRHAIFPSSSMADCDPERCDGCGVCVLRCPFGAWQSSERRPTFLAENCLGCGVCVGACPTGALRLGLRG